jgi:TorA maturation chaperone TorD
LNHDMVRQPRQVQEADGRGKIYATLAAAFYPPTGDMTKVWGAISNGLAVYGHAPEKTVEWDDSVGKPVTVSTSKLSQEYLRLFVGPGHVYCPPYESVHRADRPEMERGLVMGPSTVDLVRRYGEAGLTVSKNFRDLPDHIAVELEFMYYLCAKESELTSGKRSDEVEEWRKRQREFVRDHLRPWVEAFGDCVLRSTCLSFYGSAAALLKAFVRKESEDHLHLGGESY